MGGGWILEREDAFAGPALDTSLWHPHYLPQWSSRAESAARYDLTNGALRLRIDEDQGAWCPEFDGELRVSSVQTGVFAGRVGSGSGQHRFRDDVVVREAQPALRLYAPLYGRFELQARAMLDPTTMVALWMIGFEDEPERCGEICIMEIFGRDVTDAGPAVGMGVHPHHDHRIREDFERVRLPIDVRESHRYAAEWTPSGIRFFVDDSPVRAVDQSPPYPMQLMLGIYEFRDASGPAGRYPKEFVVESFRAWRPA